MNFLFDLVSSEEEEFTDSKKDVLKYLKIIGVDSRFISLFNDKIYITNLRFSKFSRKREAIFNKQYPKIQVIRSSLFMKICLKSSRSISDSIIPGKTVYIPNDFIAILFEPYTRKYGLKLVFDKNDDYNLEVSSLILDDEVNNIFTDIFSGEGIDFNRINDEKIYPLLLVPKKWIVDFCLIEGINNSFNDDKNNLACSFMEFLDDVSPQFRDNVIKARNYLKN